MTCRSNDSYIATVFERQTRFTMLVKVESKDTDYVANTLPKQMSKLPELLQRCLAQDRGQGMASHHAYISDRYGRVLFDPQSPWQLGTNENAISLLSKYVQAGIGLSGFT